MRRCQVFEPVRVDRPPVPRLQLVRHPLGGVAPLAVAVPASQPVELGAIRTQQLCQTLIEVLRLDEPGLELRDGRAECLGEACEPGSVPRQPSQQQRPLGVGEHGPVGSVAVGEAREQVVERRHPAADDRLAAGEEIPPNALRLGSVGHEQNRVARDVRGIAVEQEGDLAGIRRPRKQRQRHATQSRAGACRPKKPHGGLDSSCPPFRFPLRGDLGAPTSAGDCTARLLSGAAVAEISLP